MINIKFNYKIFLFIFSLLLAGICFNVSAYGEDNVKSSLSKKTQQSVKENTFVVTGTELQPKSNVYAITGSEKQGKVKSVKQTEFVVTGITGTENQSNKESVVNISGTETQNKSGKQTKLADSSKSVNVAEPSAVSSVNKKQNKKESKEKETVSVVKEPTKEEKARRYMTFCSGNFFHFYGYEEEDKDKMDMEEYFKKFKETSKTGKTFELTGTEIGKKKDTSLTVTGKETSNKYKQKEDLTDYQKAKLEYILMEEENKLFGLKRMLIVAKKLLYSELSKENYNLSVIANLKQEILSTASDIELVKFETECKIRGLLSLEQYKKIESKIQKRRSL